MQMTLQAQRNGRNKCRGECRGLSPRQQQTILHVYVTPLKILGFETKQGDQPEPSSAVGGHSRPQPLPPLSPAHVALAISAPGQDCAHKLCDLALTDATSLLNQGWPSSTASSRGSMVHTYLHTVSHLAFLKEEWMTEARDRPTLTEVKSRLGLKHTTTG
jgi:hypothetical protein